MIANKIRKHVCVVDITSIIIRVIRGRKVKYTYKLLADKAGFDVSNLVRLVLSIYYRTVDEVHDVSRFFVVPIHCGKEIVQFH